MKCGRGKATLNVLSVAKSSKLPIIPNNYLFFIYMKDNELFEELDDIVSKLKMRVIFYQTENKELKKRIEELKKYVKNN